MSEIDDLRAENEALKRQNEAMKIEADRLREMHGNEYWSKVAQLRTARAQINDIFDRTLKSLGGNQ